MACTRWSDQILDHAYGEMDPPEERRFLEHLPACRECLEDLETVRDARALLHEGELAIPSSPRVVVLRPAPRWVPALAVAASFGLVALLAGTAIGARWGSSRSVPSQASALPAASSAAYLTLPEFEKRLRGEREAILQALADRENPAASVAQPDRLTPHDLETAIGRLERRIDARRAEDLDYVLKAVAATDIRNSERIGQTQDALKYVALASNPLTYAH